MDGKEDNGEELGTVFGSILGSSDIGSDPVGGKTCEASFERDDMLL